MYSLFQEFKEQIENQKDRFSLWLSVLFAIGIGTYFALPFEPSMWFSLVFIELIIVLAIIWRFKPLNLLVIMVLGLIVLGFTDAQLKTIYLAKQETIATQTKLYITGRIKDVDYNSRGKKRVVLDNVVDFDNKYKFDDVKIALMSKTEPFVEGQCIELIANLMPLPKTSIVGGFQFDRKSFFEGIGINGYALSFASEVECSQAPSFIDKFDNLIAIIRNKIIANINQVLPPDEASITAAIVAGEKGKISKTLINNYRDSGLAHFLSISGLHMSMIAGLMFFLVRLIITFVTPISTRYDSKKISAIFAILISIFYLLISGAQVPTQRAFIMTFIVLLGVIFSRRAISMKTISWAAFIVLIIAPQALIGASFQMSFAAVIALIAFYERYAGSLHRFLQGDNSKDNPIWLKTVKIFWIYVIGILVSDLVASLATLPFAIYHFNRIAIYTTLANLLAGPIIGLIIMPFVLVSLLLMPLGLDAFTLKIVGFGVAKVNEITAFVSSIPNAGFPVLAMPLWGLLLIVFGGLWLCIWTSSLRRWGWIGVVIGFLSLFTAKIPDVIINDDASLVALKDNQGELVILPSRGHYFDKKIWLDKTASRKLSSIESKEIKKIYKGELTNKNWIDLVCNDDYCVYKEIIKINKLGGIKIKNEDFVIKDTLGASIYLREDKVEIKTVRKFVGDRPWN